MRQIFLGMVTMIVLSSGALAGCSASDSPDVPEAAAQAPLPNSVMFGEFSAHVDKKARTMTIRQTKGGQAYGPNLEPQSVDSLNIVQDGVPGSGPAQTVELVNISTDDLYPGEDTFTAVVDLRHFFARSFANVYVQITAETDANGNPTTAYDAQNSDSGAAIGLSTAHGLWQYTATGAPPGVLTQSPFNVGEREWIFNNPDDGDCDYVFAVWASKGFANYTFGFPNLGYVDACSGGTSFTNPSKPAIALPFDFTLYNVNASQVNVARNGQVTLGTTALTASGTSLALPTTSAPHPVLFTFWDSLAVGAGGQMCFQTIGSAPNRQFVIEWRGMNFSTGAGSSPASSLDFETYLYEGTGEIDTVYNSMVGGSTSGGRETGTSATVGVQDETGTISTSEHDIADYGTGNAWSYIPSAI
jgi:hypothetical protein